MHARAEFKCKNKFSFVEVESKDQFLGTSTSGIDPTRALASGSFFTMYYTVAESHLVFPKCVAFQLQGLVASAPYGPGTPKKLQKVH